MTTIHEDKKKGAEAIADQSTIPKTTGRLEKKGWEEDPYRYRRFYELMIFFFIFCLFLSVLIIESLSLRVGHRSNFFYDIYLNNHLLPRLDMTTHPSALLEMAMEENRDTQIFIWRQVCFISFMISLFTLLVMKLFFPLVPLSFFFLLFLCLFMMLFLSITLFNFHYYANKSRFIDACLIKYKSSIVAS